MIGTVTKTGKQVHLTHRYKFWKHRFAASISKMAAERSMAMVLLNMFSGAGRLVQNVNCLGLRVCLRK